mgnify:CR=1 FL=1
MVVLTGRDLEASVQGRALHEAEGPRRVEGPEPREGAREPLRARRVEMHEDVHAARLAPGDELEARGLGHLERDLERDVDGENTYETYGSFSRAEIELLLEEAEEDLVELERLHGRSRAPNSRWRSETAKPAALSSHST